MLLVCLAGVALAAAAIAWMRFAPADRGRRLAGERYVTVAPARAPLGFQHGD